jgi:hypothetical protein
MGYENPLHGLDSGPDDWSSDIGEEQVPDLKPDETGPVVTLSPEQGRRVLAAQLAQNLLRNSRGTGLFTGAPVKADDIVSLARWFVGDEPTFPTDPEGTLPGE